MVELKPYDVNILEYLSSCNTGASPNELELRFGCEYQHSLEDMERQDLVHHKHSDSDFKNIPAGLMPSPTGNWEITDAGKLFLKRHVSVKILKTKEIWSNRAWGFIVGVATGLIVGYILFMLGWS